jgi:hypothetical protein
MTATTTHADAGAKTRAMRDGRQADSMRRRERVLTALDRAVADGAEVGVSAVARAAEPPASSSSRTGSPKRSANTPGASPGSATRPTSTPSTSGSPTSSNRSSTDGCNSTNATTTLSRSEIPSAGSASSHDSHWTACLSRVTTSPVPR